MDHRQTDTAAPALDSEPSAAAPALVLRRWNSWVQVYLPATDEITWVDLGTTPFEPVAAGSEPTLS